MAFLATFYIFLQFISHQYLFKFLAIACRFTYRRFSCNTSKNRTFSTPITDVRASICLTVVLVYYKDCCRISKKATKSVKTLRITVDFYILYPCN